MSLSEVNSRNTFKKIRFITRNAVNAFCHVILYSLFCVDCPYDHSKILLMSIFDILGVRQSVERDKTNLVRDSRISPLNPFLYLLFYLKVSVHNI